MKKYAAVEKGERILIATGVYPPDIGGPAKYAHNLFEELSNRGMRPRLVVWGKLERTLPWGIRHAIYFLRIIPKLVGMDAVLALDTWSTGLPALFAAKLVGTKILVRVGGDPLWEQYIERTGDMVKLSEFYKKPRQLTLKERLVRSTTRMLAQRADILMFNTSWQLQIWQQAYRFDVARARVLENEYPSKREGKTTDKKIFVAAGRGIRYKNIPAFAGAFAEANKRHPDIEMDTTSLPPAQNAERLAGAYAVAVPSISEVNSNFIIEALSYGKPFICAEDSGMRGRLEGLGVFVDTSNKEAMARAIETLLDEKTYKAYTDRIQAFTYTHSWSQIVDEIIEAAKTI